MEAWRQWRGSQRAECNPRGVRRGKDRERRDRGRRAERAHEAPPHTPPGGKPPETPGPLSLGIDVPERRQSVKGSQAARKRRALDRLPPFRRYRWDEGKGAFGQAGGIPRSPGTARYARMRRCLMLRQGAGPLRPPYFPLDREWPSHGSRDREGAVARNTRPQPLPDGRGSGWVLTLAHFCVAHPGAGVQGQGICLRG
jgi:hypothetical protein